tara:strand:+ start:39430 stop:41382 length:1953 start_codon:yes stop_codon:yes gene_type:complete
MSFQLFDRLSALFKAQSIYRNETTFRDQHRLDKVTAGGNFLNFGQQNVLLEQTNLQINRLERYKDFDQMDEVGAITLALDLYADESSLVDPELKHVLTIKAKSDRVKEELEDFFYNTLLVDSHLRTWVRYLVKYGDCPFEIIVDKNRTGVINLKHMNVYNFTRIETRYGDLVGFFFQDQNTSEPVFLHPWQVSHMRLTSLENIYHPYGRSILDGARKHFKQLRLMEDAALIYRITRAPEKRVFTIPVGNIPTPEVPGYIANIARQFKKKQFFDPSTGDVNERWHPLIQEDDFWLPQRADGTGPTITTLPGAENLDDIKDIEYFKKSMVSGLKIPFDRVGLGESSGSNERSLSQVSPEFAKAIQWIQREIAMGLKKVAIVHLALQGYNAQDMRDFDIHMTASSAIDELYRIEVWQSRANVIDALRATEMFPKEWILERFTDMTKDEIAQNDEKMRMVQDQAASQMGGMGGMGGGGMGGGMGDMGMGGMEMPGEPAPSGIGAEEGLGGEGGFGADPAAGGAPQMPEGYDDSLEREVLMELHEFERRKSINEDLEKIQTIHNHGLFSSNSSKLVLNSGFENMMNNCELDGLSRLNVDDPYQADLVKPLISDDLRTRTIADTKILLVEGFSPELADDDDEITANDLPSRMIFVE